MQVRERLRQGLPFTDAEIVKRQKEWENNKLWEDIQSGAINVYDMPKVGGRMTHASHG